MFDSTSLAGLAGEALAALVESNATDLRERECNNLLLAAAWADLHTVDPEHPDGPRTERASWLGGEGTPELSEFCAAEFAALQGLSMGSGRSLIADALDLRHRLPRLWDQVRAGTVRAWKAREVSVATRFLGAEAAREVDEATAGYINALSWNRFKKVLTAAILDADPEAAREREERARTERCVWASDAEHGLKTLVARAAAGDVIFFMAAVNRIADILKAQGDADPVGARRSKAVGILAQPARALELLYAHTDDTDPHLGEPAEEDLLDDLPEMDDLPDLVDDGEPEPPEPAPATAPADDAGHPPMSEEEPVDPEQAPADPGTEGEGSHTSLALHPLTGRPRPSALRPRVVLYLHLSDAAVRAGHGVVRFEDAQPVTMAQLRAWLLDAGCMVQVRPVRIPADCEAVDAYEIPARVREAVRLRDVADVFPFANSTARGLDLDHTVPYRPLSQGGPPGQTGPDNLGPLGRTHHRAVTFGRWRRRQPDGGTYLWRSPHGWIYLTTNQGTVSLGRSVYAHAVWRAAAPPGEPSET